MTLAAVLLAFVLAAVETVSADSFPGQRADKRIVKTQSKADSLLEKQKYERAFFIYRNDLAPIGDKYAQYIIGYMYLTGKGVEEDLSTAAAWYRLAAERGNQNFVTAHNQLFAALNNEQRARTEEVFVGLRNELGDANMIMSLIENDLAYLNGVARPNPYLVQEVTQLAGRDEEETAGESTIDRIRQRIVWLDEKLSSDKLATAAEQEKYAALVSKVEEGLSKYASTR